MEKNMLPKDEEKVLEINDVASCFRKFKEVQKGMEKLEACLLYTSPSPRD